MESLLAEYLAPLEPDRRETVRWRGGAMELQVASYLHQGLPPLAYVTSVRGLLASPRGVVVLRDRDGPHVLPGGRREAGESLLDTLRREVREEAGCSIQSPILLGFAHFHHLTPKPADYPYPYPDFLHVIYAARATPIAGWRRDPDGWELAVEFVPPAELREVGFPSNQRPYLEAGLQALGVPA